MTLKLASNRKVIKLRGASGSVERALRAALENAHETHAVIIIEIPKNNMPQNHIFHHSKITLARLAWAMNMAQQKANKIMNPE